MRIDKDINGAIKTMRISSSKLRTRPTKSPLYSGLLMLLTSASMAILIFGCVQMPENNLPDSGEICPPGTEPAAQSSDQNRSAQNSPAPAAVPPAEEAQPAQSDDAALPRLLDLGATTCRPCIMMAPILEELKAEYEGRMQVDFVDVRLNPTPGQQYGIRAIPTQIFFDAGGNELFRHVGFFSKEEILAAWKELGYEFD